MAKIDENFNAQNTLFLSKKVKKIKKNYHKIDKRGWGQGELIRSGRKSKVQGEIKINNRGTFMWHLRVTCRIFEIITII